LIGSGWSPPKSVQHCHRVYDYDGTYKCLARRTNIYRWKCVPPRRTNSLLSLLPQNVIILGVRLLLLLLLLLLHTLRARRLLNHWRLAPTIYSCMYSSHDWECKLPTSLLLASQPRMGTASGGRVLTQAVGLNFGHRMTRAALHANHLWI